MSESVLCMDIGTTSLKAGLITEDGEVVSFCQIPFENSQDCFIGASWLNCFAASLVELNKNSTRPTKISALAISGNGPTIVTDSGFTILWNDTSFKGALPPEAARSLFIPKILTLKKNYPKEFKSTKYFFSGPEYLIYLLTGKAVTILPEQRFITAYWDESICRICKIPFNKLPPFYGTGAVCGQLNPSVMADLMGNNQFENISFAPDCKVIAGGPDFVVALIGTNTLSPGKLCDRSGSSEGINLCTSIPVFDEGVRTLPSVISGLWNASVLIPESGALDSAERIKKIKAAIKKLEALAVKNKLPFSSEMAVTGGQTKDVLLMKEKADILNVKIIHTTVNGQNFAHSELLGDACAAYVALGKYKSLQEAAGILVKQKA